MSSPILTPPNHSSPPYRSHAALTKSEEYLISNIPSAPSFQHIARERPGAMMLRATLPFRVQIPHPPSHLHHPVSWFREATHGKAPPRQPSSYTSRALDWDHGQGHRQDDP
ncbi:hypothetical protein L198_06177 [Cryptococcus wingfieldii CBS 7118]|uniref:Uncharacterized protein n=1 Tax=Cryptococcus wingfieldii CBS 7118 TaxID=1295528 RepID=A0A1E3INI1_9TREE|nr:hypothetical protein L198_06177 [Cryptococcus wingfieldii CBS 7118]ODN90159.1 hypothetical protein L198_06177 [Cryptococcus wingfieldii CBS 7118]